MSYDEKKMQYMTNNGCSFYKNMFSNGKKSLCTSFRYVSILFFFIICFFVIILSSNCAHGKIYIWTDHSGIKQFSNIAPPRIRNHRIRLFDETNADKSRPVNKLPGSLRHHDEFKVIKVYDGDTIKVKGYNNLIIVVRFAGIDAPETGKNGEPGQPYGEKAKKMVQRIISGKKIILKTYGTGGYNRVLAEIFTRNGVNINLELVRKGLAEVYSGHTSNGFDKSPYFRAEAAAKRARRGMWALGSQYESPWKWRRDHPWKR